MNIEYHNNFIKNFKKRFRENYRIRNAYKKRLKMFVENSQNPILKDHKLIGSKITLRAFSVTGDIRIIYEEIEDRIIFLDIGTHNQVY